MPTPTVRADHCLTYRLRAHSLPRRPPEPRPAAPAAPAAPPAAPAPDSAIPRRTCSLPSLSSFEKAADGTRSVQPSCIRRSQVIRAGPVSTAAEGSFARRPGASDCFYRGRPRASALLSGVSRSVTNQTPSGLRGCCFGSLMGLLHDGDIAPDYCGIRGRLDGGLRNGLYSTVEFVPEAASCSHDLRYELSGLQVHAQSRSPWGRECACDSRSAALYGTADGRAQTAVGSVIARPVEADRVPPR